MLQWCMAHPWMTFLLIGFILLLIAALIENHQNIKVNSQKSEMTKLQLQMKEGDDNN